MRFRLLLALVLSGCLLCPQVTFAEQKPDIELVKARIASLENELKSLEKILAEHDESQPPISVDRGEKISVRLDHDASIKYVELAGIEVSDEVKRHKDFVASVAFHVTELAGDGTINLTSKITADNVWKAKHIVELSVNPKLVKLNTWMNPSDGTTRQVKTIYVESNRIGEDIQMLRASE